MEIAKKLTKGNRFGCLFETIPATIRHSRGTRSCGREAEILRHRTGRKAPSTLPGTVQALKFWQETIKQNVAPRNFLGGGGGDIVANLASGLCAMQNCGIWASVHCDRMRRISNTAFFRFPCRQTACRKAFWEDGLLSPMQRAKPGGSCKVLCLGARFDA